MSYIKRLSIFLFALHYKFFNKEHVILSIRASIDFNTTFEGNNRIGRNVSIVGTHVGRGTYIGKNSTLDLGNIGKFCSIAPSVECVYGAHPLAPYVSTHPAFFSLRKQAGFTFVTNKTFEESRLTKDLKSFSIGNDVWIGYGVRIMEGISIGNGSVVAAGSIVTKDIPSYEIWGGIPSKKIKDRFSEEVKVELSKIRWWDKDFNELRELAALFKDISELIKRFGNEADSQDSK